MYKLYFFSGYHTENKAAFSNTNLQTADKADIEHSSHAKAHAVHIKHTTNEGLQSPTGAQRGPAIFALPFNKCT